MGLYLQQIKPEDEGLETLWKDMTGDKKVLNIREFHDLYDRVMPSICDREVALEVFQELDADKDGKLVFKDFHDAMLFQF